MSRKKFKTIEKAKVIQSHKTVSDFNNYQRIRFESKVRTLKGLILYIIDNFIHLYNHLLLQFYLSSHDIKVVQPP